MCDQTEVSYLPDDVVWVKLSNVWWPAQVQDESKLDEDVTSGLRKKPLAVVKFFDEDLYEFPKNLNQIYHYNCFKKDEFIKKGLDLCRPSGYREVSENMKKFPLDVKKAEIMTGGNPDIINDPKYQPEEKFDYREQFGLKPRKKSSLGSKHNNSDSTMETPKPSRVKFSTPISAPSTSRTPETKISNVSKSFSNPIRRTMAVKRTASGILRNGNVDKENDSKQFSTGRYYCSYCDYSCCRMGVIIEHYRSHYRGWISPLPNQTPQSYSKVFQSNLLKRKEYVSSTPNAGPKHVSEKTSVKRKSVEDSTPIKKRKHESTKKEKVSVSASGSSLSIPTKDMVGSAAVPKKRQRKSKDTKSVTAKELEALDILKDWEDDSDEETEIKLSSPEINETDQAKDASKSVSDSVSENEEQAQPPPQEHKKEVTSKEKCCFDFEDNDESLNLNKSLKFGQKLPRVISEEKPNVQRLLKELKESKEPLLKKEESINEDFNEEIENLLKNTEVPKLPGIPKTSLPKSIEKSVTEDFPKPQKEVTEIKESSEDYGGEPSKEIEIQAEESSSMIESVTSSQTTVQSAIIVEKSTASENDAAVDSASEAIEKKTDEPKSSKEKNVSNFTKNSTSVSNTSVTENITDINRSDTKNSEEKEHLTQEACSTKDILEQDISRNESKSSSNESESQSVMNSETCEADTVLPSTTTESTLNKDTEISLNVTEKEEEISGSFTEEKVTNIVDQLAPMEVEIDSHEEMSTSKANKEQDIVEQNDGLQNIENISISEVNSSNENDEKSLKEVEITDKQNDLGPIPVDDTMKIQVVSSSVKNDVVAKSEPSTSLETPSDQIPFDINSMPIVIDQDPIMEIMEGHVEPLPNADVVRVFIRNSGEEEPEDFQGPKRLLTVSPPPPNLPPIPGVKKIPLPPPKNKNGANSSNKVSGNVTSGSTARYTLNKQPPKNVSQQPKILFIKNTTGGPSKLLIPQQQSSIFAQAGKLQPGTRIITTNPQLVSKGPVQKKVTSKSIVVGKQGFPTTAKVVQKSVIGQVIQKVSQQPIICNKNASTVLVNSPKTIVSRSVGRNVLLSSQQLKTTTAMQVTAGTKVVRAAQVVKTPGTVFQQAEAVLPQKVVQSTSALNDNKKQIIKNKQLSPNILQRTQRKVSRQQVIKKSQLLTIPSSVQQQSREVVTVNNLPIVQSIGSHSSSEPLGMVYYVGNSQYAVENPVIPVENDNQNVYVTSTSSSGNLDNIIFSIDGTTNFVNISNDTATPTSTHVPSQDILAKALANTQVLQSETTDIVDGENTVYVDQQFQAPSLSNTVLETSLTLNQPPIMTPLEVPSSITPQSNVSHIIPITNITKKADIPQPSMPLLTDDVDVPGNTVFLSDSSAIPTTSGHLTFQLVHDNNLVSSGIMQEKSIKLDTDSKEDNVLPEFLKGNFGSKSEVPKKEPSPKRSER